MHLEQLRRPNMLPVGRQIPPLIMALVDYLPPAGSPWTREEADKWLEACRRAFDVHFTYEDEEAPDGE